ncbi:MAG: DUF2099 family protein [Candidatus Methanoperedens sp.]|nr:DUF2099 family protein [Candidatus Methanoperedens sp.]
MSKSRHVMELQGRTRVVVENGKVIEVGMPMTEYCPIFDKVRGIKKFTPKTAKENVEFRMRDFGMFTENRELEMEIFVGFGASETFMTALRRGLLDITITVCDGAGTVITSNPRLCQGMGSRISGLTETSPIKRIIERIQAAGGVVLDTDTAAIDQVRGVRKAIELGYRKIGVSVAALGDLKEIRNIEKESGTEITAFGVHATGMPDNEAKEFIELIDMATGCTSKWIRAGVAGKTIAQFGTAVPIFAITRRGRELLLERAKEVRDPILVNTMKLPVLPDERQPRPLV